MKAPYQIILRPLLTEKANELKESLSKVVFEVAPDANKIEIRKAVESAFAGVKVESVHTQIVRGKWKRQGRFVGRRKNWKRAIITLREGEISFFEDTNTEETEA
jgi:large subunit ribosomal protein L23